ncbi:uncharacterized protein L969DRAFT_61487 [Mixia osmundae IAM 14324]|uniref:SAC domain-containing protein n=1 Tax=Mixia osmundae (strain CBS 9802 / IAM 14324 / JCM 22182 / KY 12970) TaxID=764103 RepID=G7E6J5_MIXOS|nr:uncharacterized protein L969DRAFT_61487 [Mixia osmundae IAM 14324]KEI40387.1 hypothetical protein L969DRAFT_61487 [Mixia osmundae IAM 14324]GAA98455.1 hypothetical protein E5Q_05141 [Mixia osmundae IAM 14324]
MALHENLRFYVGKDAYHLVDEGPQGQTLTITRKTNEIIVNNGAKRPQQYDTMLKVYGLFGIVSLLNSEYIILITGIKRVATLLSHPVYQATDFKVFAIEPMPFEWTVDKVLAAGHPNEKYLLSLVKSHLYSGPFYFSYGYDLTRSLQAQSKSGNNGPAWKLADDRFFWNKYLQSRMIETASRQDVSKFILPVIFGFFEIKQADANGRDFLFGVISRRSRYRAGTRYFSRGIDLDGHVANFNETEMLTLMDKPSHGSAVGGNRAPIKGEIRGSYIQTRGSVPIFWAEINNLRYKPDLKIMDLDATHEATKKHFDEQVEIYGDQFLVSLVNQKGYERPVKEGYEKAVQTLGNPRVHYTYFDYHHECKGMRFDRVSILIDKLESDLIRQGYFFHDTSSSQTPQKTQTSVVRTNCMDCLDRTGVVQAALAKWALTQQLQAVGIFSSKETVDDHPRLQHIFRNLWADNADGVSVAYSGTGALKTDYTRTGKRSKQGALQDGINSAVRYIKNNFLDGPRQDAYDVVTGRWQPRKGRDAAFGDARPFFARFVPYVLLLSIVALFFGISSPRFTSQNFYPLKTFFAFWIVVTVISTAYIAAHGVDYVAYPRLNPLTDIITYDGKGYESGRKGRASFAALARLPATMHRKMESLAEVELGKKRVD